MAKLQVFFVLVAIFGLLAATAFAAVDTDNGEENQGSLRRCQEQIQRQRLQSCERFLTQRRGSREMMEMEEDDDEEMMKSSRREREPLEECCQQLKRMDETCRCQGIRQIVQRQRQQRQLQGHEMRQMIDRASNLPSICRLGQRRCDVVSLRY